MNPVTSLVQVDILCNQVGRTVLIVYSCNSYSSKLFWKSRGALCALLFNLLVGRISKRLYLVVAEITAPANISRPAVVTRNVHEFIVREFTMNVWSVTWWHALLIHICSQRMKFNVVLQRMAGYQYKTKSLSYDNINNQLDATITVY